VSRQAVDAGSLRFFSRLCRRAKPAAGRTRIIAAPPRSGQTRAAPSC